MERPNTIKAAKPYTFLGLFELAAAFSHYHHEFVHEALKNDLLVAMKPNTKLEKHSVIRISSNELDLTRVLPSETVLIKMHGKDLMPNLAKLKRVKIQFWGIEKCLRTTGPELAKLLKEPLPAPAPAPSAETSVDKMDSKKSA
jgi:hypothetical protein